MQIPNLINQAECLSLKTSTGKAEACISGKIYSISVDHISPNKYQPRKSFDSVSLLRLADSIKRYGVLQPITVRLARITPDKQSFYEIICGERRYRAAIIAGLTTIPCNVIDSSDMGTAELSIIENLLRDDLNMFEQAESFNLLITTFSLTQEEVASRISLSQSAVANKLRLLRFTSDERKMIIESGLTERHARTLLRLPDMAARIRFIKLISKDKLNVASTETLVDNYLQFITENPEEADNPSGSSTHGTKYSTGIVKDIRILTNTIENAAVMLRKSGIPVETKTEETQESVIITVSVFKRKTST
jgi:ParB family chromosome partitioning protein